MAIEFKNMTQPEIEAALRRAGDAVRSVLGDDSQFALLAFDDPRSAQYISTCTRDSMILAMREAVIRLEHGLDVPADGYTIPPHHQTITQEDVRSAMKDDSIIDECLALIAAGAGNGDSVAHTLRIAIAYFLFKAAGWEIPEAPSGWKEDAGDGDATDRR